MHPVLKRILIHGALTAVLLALIGLFFTQLANMWTAGNTSQPGSADTNTPMMDSVRMNVPLMMAFWGFVFVAVGEFVRWRFVGKKKEAAKLAESQPDDAEKLLNELLEQAESKMALEAESQRAEAGEQSAEDRGQRTEDREQKTENRGWKAE